MCLATVLLATMMIPARLSFVQDAGEGGDGRMVTTASSGDISGVVVYRKEGITQVQTQPGIDSRHLQRPFDGGLAVSDHISLTACVLSGTWHVKGPNQDTCDQMRRGILRQSLQCFYAKRCAFSPHTPSPQGQETRRSTTSIPNKHRALYHYRTLLITTLPTVNLLRGPQLQTGTRGIKNLPLSLSSSFNICVSVETRVDGALT